METKEQKLPIEFKEKWIAALKSGEYEQGRGFLFRDDKYCCLGVACRAAGMPIAAIDQKRSIRKDLPGVSVIPEAITGTVWENDLAMFLSNMNDSGGKSFAEIATYIEENL